MSTTQAKDYMERIRSACSVNNGQLIHGAWSDETDPANHKQRHLSFARDFGYALADFDSKARRELITSSYSVVYVRACDLKPALSAKEWSQARIEGLKRAEDYRKEGE
jgi:hypothetical protein